MSTSLFPGVDSLVGLARHGVDVKPTLLRVLTDLYVQKASHTPEEERQFVELTLRLIDSVDAATRAAVTRRLMDYPAAPAAVVRRLADTAPNVDAREPGSAPDEAGAEAPAAATLAEAATLVERFFAAEAAQRLAILAALDARGALESAVWPAPAEGAARRLEESALAGRPGDFVRELERALGVTRAFAERIVNDRSGEPLVVAAKALAMPIDALQRILLFVNPLIGHSVRRVYALTALFDETSLAAALRLVAAWRTIASAARHPGRRGPAAGAATPAPRGAAILPARQRDDASPADPKAAPSPHDPIEKTAS